MKILIAIPYFGYLDNVPLMDTLFQIAKDNCFMIKFIRGYHVTQARNEALKFAIANRFTHLLFIDSDIIMTVEQIYALVNANHPFVSLPYMRKDGTNLTEVMIFDNGIMRKMAKEEFANDSKFFDVAGNGFGACLIDLSVLKFDFRFLYSYDIGMSEDYYLCTELEKHGITHRVLNDFVGHISQVQVYNDNVYPMLT